MSRERWDALIRGDGCPLCSVVQAAEIDDPYGYFVADLEGGRLRLAADQHLPGYCLLISKKHVREPYELEREERTAFFEDMSRVGEALERVYGALKINYEILGNSVPHLHCHIQPRYYGDPYPNRPATRPAQWDALPEARYRERAAAIRAALRL